MPRRYIATPRSVAADQIDLIYVAPQINLDLQALSKAYPTLLSLDTAVDLFNALVTFMANHAVDAVGFSVYDPKQGNKVYHELRYIVQSEGDRQPIVPAKERWSARGRPIESIWIPASAHFTPWVIWSDRMLELPVGRQQVIVSGTKWKIPGQSRSIVFKYENEQTDNSIDIFISGKKFLYAWGLAGDSTTDAPPPDVRKKQKKGKGK